MANRDVDMAISLMRQFLGEKCCRKTIPQFLWDSFEKLQSSDAPYIEKILSEYGFAVWASYILAPIPHINFDPLFEEIVALRRLELLPEPCQRHVAEQVSKREYTKLHSISYRR